MAEPLPCRVIGKMAGGERRAHMVRLFHVHQRPSSPGEGHSLQKQSMADIIEYRKGRLHGVQRAPDRQADNRPRGASTITEPPG